MLFVVVLCALVSSKINAVNLADILAPVAELMYYCSLPKCTTECTISHIKIQECFKVINPDPHLFGDHQ